MSTNFEKPIYRSGINDRYCNEIIRIFRKRVVNEGNISFKIQFQGLYLGTIGGRDGHRITRRILKETVDDKLQCYIVVMVKRRKRLLRKQFCTI